MNPSKEMDDLKKISGITSVCIMLCLCCWLFLLTFLVSTWGMALLLHGLLLRCRGGRLLLLQELLLPACRTECLEFRDDVGTQCHEREGVTGLLLKVQEINILLHFV